MKTIVEMKFGSSLYGTSTPASDLDIKAVHIPTARDILLQRVKPVYNVQTKADPTAKNSASDVDRESYSLQKYLALVADGQTVALDMLFAPDFAMLVEPHPLWREIQANKDRLLSRQYGSFVGYCRQQANKYGVKGSRVAASRKALALVTAGMAKHGTTAKLVVIAPAIEEMTEATPHMAAFNHVSAGETVVRHWDVCGRKMPYTSTIKNAVEIMQKLVDEYGQRALQAETNQGVDWKALSHAVRIGRQAIGLLMSGTIAFPRPDAKELLAIKTGAVPYKKVADEIDLLLDQIETFSARSTLPEKPDREWIDDFVARAHLAQMSEAA